MTPFRKPVLPAARPAEHAGLSGEGGFSLIFMSLFLTAAAILMVSILPEAGNDNAKTISDVEKLQEVEEHMRSFMAYNRRRPCPADGQYPDNSPNFGREAAIAGTCQGGTPNAPLGPDATGNIIAGTIPTRSIGLDTSYAFDGYGRPFTYVVDKRATTTATCDALEGIELGSTTPTGKGGLYIKDAAGNTIDQVMYAYISYGPSGYGAWPDQGSATTLTAAQSAARRINSGSTNQFMQVNAGVDVAASPPGASTFTTNSTNFKNYLYKNSMILPSTTGGLDTGFNDLVWYRDDLKNTCCLGKKCIPIGFRIDSSPTTGYPLQLVGTADINGDGIPDLIIGHGYGGGGNENIYVVFGTPTGWPIPPNGLDPSTLDGTNGFLITGSFDTLSGYTSSNMSVGDINGDGYDDLFFCGSWSTYCYVIFGGPGACKANTAKCDTSTAPAAWVSGGAMNAANLAGYTGVNGTSGVKIDTTGIDGNATMKLENGPWTAIGKIDDSGYKSLVALGQCYPGPCSDVATGFVLYGMPPGTPGSNTPGTWSGTSTVTVSSFNGTSGFEIHSSNANLMPFHVGTLNIGLGASFDFDHDGYDDITIGSNYATGAPITQSGAIFILYGRTRAYWSASLTGTAPAFLDLAAELNVANNGTHCGSAVTCATEFYNTNAADTFFGFGANGGNLIDVDLNGDLIPDLVTAYVWSFPTIIYGGTRYPATFDVNTLTSAQGFTISTACCNRWPASLGGTFSTVAAADVNGDGRNDLLLSTAGTGASLNGRTNPGDVLVMYQPAAGWASLGSIRYSTFKWDDTDSFQIIGPKNNSLCGASFPPFVADVRPGDSNKPEIMISCYIGENSYGSIYGLYKNKGWPSSIDLNDLN